MNKKLQDTTVVNCLPPLYRDDVCSLPPCHPGQSATVVSELVCDSCIVSVKLRDSAAVISE